MENYERWSNSSFRIFRKLVTFSLLKDRALIILGGGRGVAVIIYMVGVEVLIGVLVILPVDPVDEFMVKERKRSD